MAYDGVNVSKLERALNQIDDINAEKLIELCNNLDEDGWKSSVRKRIKDALLEVAKQYKEIQSKVNVYKSVVASIDEYKTAADNYEKYSNKLADAKKKYEKYNSIASPNSSDEYWKKYYKQKCDEYSKEKSNYSSDKSRFQTKINNLMN